MIAFELSARKFTVSTAAALAMVLAICVAAYMRGIFGGFLYDDYPNIVANKTIQIDGTSFEQWRIAATSSGAGVLKRPISTLSFAANHVFFGLSPLAFKAVNVLIHLLNGCLVFLLARSIQSPGSALSTPNSQLRDISALVLAALWLLNPLNVSSVLYVVQRMTLLSATFTLGGLALYAKGRLRMLNGEPGLLLATVGLVICTSLAALSKENGLLAFPLALVIEWTCFRFRDSSARGERQLLVFFGVVIALPALTLLLFLVSNPQWLAHGYISRDFTLTERLLTEPRILWHYVLWIFIPNPAWMGMYHDDILVSKSILHPASTIVALAGWGAVSAAAVALRRRRPEIALCILWFLVGHSMESTAIPLELTFEHRNYIPMIGLLFGPVTLLRDRIGHYPRAARVLTVSAISICAVLTMERATTWGDPLKLAMSFASHHPQSASSQYDAGRAIVFRAESEGRVNEGRVAARPYFLRAMALDPTDVNAAVGLVLTYANKDPIPQNVIDELVERLRKNRRLFPQSLAALLAALADRWIVMPKASVEQLVAAALDNPSLNTAGRAILLAAYGRYEFQVGGDKQTAISATIAAAELQKYDPVYRLKLAALALALGNKGLVQENLDAAAALDPAGIYLDERLSITRKLMDLSHGSPYGSTAQATPSDATGPMN